MPLSVIREGLALVKTWDPREASVGGRLEPAWLPVFYNPVMVFNRDLSVASLQAYIDLYAPHRGVTVVEPLTATGVRAVRYALEVEGIERVVAGDIDPKAVRLALENVELNRVEGRVSVVRADANALMYRLRYEDPTPVLAVDLDPYGSPAPFLRAAVALIGHKGLLAMTATDVAVLEVAKREAARRRYHVTGAPTPQSKETAARVLAGFVARVAAEHDKAVKPLLVYHADHYIRVYFLVERGARRADRVLQENLGYLTYCRHLGYAVLNAGCPEPSGSVRVEPLWTGPLYDEAFVERVIRILEGRAYLETRQRGLKLMKLILEEAGLDERVHQRLDALCSALRLNMPRMSAVLEGLESMGYRACRTHFSPIGLRTDAGYPVISSLLSELSCPRRGSTSLAIQRSSHGQVAGS
ncbi:tRNA (guanine(10)-N(2))-dimethyltransferase [Stetteria hydrogenophila]